MKDYDLRIMRTPDQGSYYIVDFTVDGVPFARRAFCGHSKLYAQSAGQNWIDGVLSEQHFTMEEFLLAGAYIGP